MPTNHATVLHLENRPLLHALFFKCSRFTLTFLERGNFCRPFAEASVVKERETIYATHKHDFLSTVIFRFIVSISACPFFHCGAIIVYTFVNKAARRETRFIDAVEGLESPGEESAPAGIFHACAR